MDDPSRFIVDHWLGIVIFTVGIMLFSAVTQMGKPIWWTCAGTIILAALAIFIGFWKLDNHLESRNQASRENSNSVPDSAPPAEPSPSPAPTDSSLPVAPHRTRKFTIRYRNLAVVRFGGKNGASITFNLDENGNAAIQNAIQVQDPGNLNAYAKDHIVYFDGFIWSGSHGVQMRGTELLDPPHGWDMSWDDMAVEIVDAEGIPVFQAESTSDTDLTVSGIFGKSPQMVVVLNNGIKIGMSERLEFQRRKLTPIFRHPDSKFGGVRIMSSIAREAFLKEEEARLARQPRHLTDQQMQAIIEVAKPLAGETVIIGVADQSSEAVQFAEQLAATFKTAGWTVQKETIPESNPPVPPGVWLLIKNWNSIPKSFHCVEEAFDKSGVEFQADRAPDIAPTWVGIRVGSKP